MSSGGRTTNGAETIIAEFIGADVAQFNTLTVNQNTVLNNLTVTGALNIPGTVALANINCQTLTASSFVKAKNNTNEYALLQTTASTDPDPSQSILSTSTGSQGLDIITLGTGKKIQLISDECHMVAGYSVFPTLPVGISLFSNTLIALDAITSIALRATTTTSVTCSQGLTLSGGTTASLVSTNQGLTLTGNTTAALSTTSGALTITGKTTTTITATDSFLALQSTSAAVTVTGNTNTTITATTGAASLSGATTALVSAGGALTLQGGAASTLSAGAALTLTGASIGITSAVDSTIRALAGNVSVDAIQVAGVGGLISLTSLSALGAGATGILLQTGTGAIALTTGGGAIALTTGAGALNFYVGVGGINIAVTGGAISMGTTAGNVSVGTSSLGTLWLYSGNSVQVTSGGGGSSAGIYLNTAASNGSGQAYNWRFPSGPGTAGQVLTSQGSSSAQTWSTVVAADANGNISANNFFSNSQTISANGTTTMTVASPFFYYITAGGGTVIILLPNATTLPNGAMFYFNMNGTSALSIRRSDGTTIKNFNQGSYVTFELLSNATSAGTWDYHSSIPSNVTWNSTAISGSQTFTTTNTTLASSGTVGSIVTSGGFSGVNAWLTSSLALQNGTGGSSVLVKPSTGTYTQFDFILPSTLGTTGQVLTSAGSGNALTWSSASSLTSPLTITVAGTASSNMLTGLVPSLATANSVNLYLGSATSSNNAAVFQFVNTGGSGSALNSLNMGLYGTNCMTMTSATTLFSTALDVNLPSITSNIFISTLSAGPVSPVAQEIKTRLGSYNGNVSLSGFYITRKYVLTGGTGSTSNYYEISHETYGQPAQPYNGYWRYFGSGKTVQQGSFNVDLQIYDPTANLTNTAMEVLQSNLSTTTPGSALFFNFGRTNTANDCVQLVWNGYLRSAVLGINSGASLELAPTVATFNRAIATNVSGTSSSDIFKGLVSSLATANSVNLYLGSATSSNNAAVVQFVNTGGSGSASNSLNMGLYGTNCMTMTSTNTAFTTTLSQSVSGTVSTDIFTGLVPSLATSNSVNLYLGKAATTNNSAVVQFVNTGGAGSASNSLNMGLYGTNCMTMTTANTAFTTTLSQSISGTTTKDVFTGFVPSLASASATNINFGVSASTNNCGVIQYVRGATSNDHACNIGIYGYNMITFNNTNITIGKSNASIIFQAANNFNQIAFQNSILSTGYRPAGTTYHFQFRSGIGGSDTGNITDNGSNVTYSTSSDYRLKTNVQPLMNALERLAYVKPCTYTWIATEQEGEGFIAHELAQVIPSAVVGKKDGLKEDGSILAQGVDYSRLTPLLTKAVQELLEKIITLESRIALLESPQ